MRELLSKSVVASLMLGTSFSFFMFHKEVENAPSEGNPVQVYKTQEKEDVLIMRVTSNLELEAHSEFNLKDHLEVRSTLHGDVTGLAKTTKEVDTFLLGEQAVDVPLTDSEGDYYNQRLVFNVVDTTPPDISAPDVTITLGTHFDLMTDVTASDTVDGDLTQDIQVESDLTTQQIGAYEVHYQVSDKSKNTGQHTRLVTVVADESQDSTSTLVNSGTVVPIEVKSEVDEVTLEQELPDGQQESYESQMAPQRIQFLGYDIAYENGGMSAGQGIIDSGYLASTWGGNAYQSGYDQANTHFIGHNPGVFSALFSLDVGVEISISDSQGNISVYQVTRLFEVDDAGIGLADGLDYWELIAGSGGGERVTFQTCISDVVNLIVEAIWVR